jgi:Flp pilus assembly protein TadD
MAERSGRLDVTESHLRKVIAKKPDHAHAYNALGYSLADKNVRLEEAQALIEKALQLAPEDPFILDSMGWVLFRRGDPQGALQYLKRAFGVRPDPEIAAHLGEVMWVLGQREDAMRVWREASSQFPGNAPLTQTIQRFTP